MPLAAAGDAQATAQGVGRERKIEGGHLQLVEALPQLPLRLFAPIEHFFHFKGFSGKAGDRTVGGVEMRTGRQFGQAEAGGEQAECPGLAQGLGRLEEIGTDLIRIADLRCRFFFWIESEAVGAVSNQDAGRRGGSRLQQKQQRNQQLSLQQMQHKLQ